MMTATVSPDVTFTPSGVKVDILSTHDDGEYFMVKSKTTGKVFFAHKNQIEQKDVAKDSDGKAKPVKSRRGRQVVKPQVPAPNRFNLNAATPELLTQILPGVGMKTATEIIELRMSLPGERFSKLEQLRQIKHVNWDEILNDSIFVE
jgi:DNA uptake protein ComE-like DNA-binding protein